MEQRLTSRTGYHSDITPYPATLRELNGWGSRPCLNIVNYVELVQNAYSWGGTCSCGNLWQLGKEMFLRLSSHLAISISSPNPIVLVDIYGRLKIILVDSIPEPSWHVNFILPDFVLVLLMKCRYRYDLYTLQ